MEIKDWLFDENEQPLERFLPNGGYAGIFRRIAVVGDSLSSGEFEVKLESNGPKYYDIFEQSWGQYLGRLIGSEVYNFSAGGMTAKNYCTAFGDARGVWAVERACQAYIIALGVNDLREIEVGTVEDVDLENWRNNKPTFAGYFATIVQRYKEIQPNAVFFFVTVPDDERDMRKEKREAHAKLMYDFAALFSNSYVLDFGKYLPEYGDEFRENFFLNGHMNPMGYLFTSRMVAAYIDYYVRRDMKKFKMAGMIGLSPTFAGNSTAPRLQEEGFVFEKHR